MSESEAPPATPCESCGKTMVPIAYGYPGDGMWEAVERGDIVLGGCVVEEGIPLWRCTSCGAQSGSMTFDRD